MSTAVQNLHKAPVGDTLIPFDVREELEAILRSEEFRSSQRSQAFLRYVVEALYQGDEDSLKERTLGIVLFGRTPDYDTGGDSIVRVTAHDVRKRLASYQVAHQERRVSITLKPGTYVPSIDRPAIESPPPVALPPQAVQTKDRQRRIRPALWIAAFCLLIVVGVATAWTVLHARNSVLKSFWGPVLSKKKVILCTSTPNAYAIGGLPTTSGDADLDLRIRNMLSSIGQQTRMAITSDVSESELQETPVVLIGSSGTNSWTANAANNFRFQYDMINGQPVIRDIQNPERLWVVPEKPDKSHAALDYAVITRLTHSRFGPGLIAIAGSSSLSTHASGIALLASESLNTMLKDAPNDWAQKNLQLVIRFRHVQSMDYAPQVVAAVYW